MKIKEILALKRRATVTVKPTASIAELSTLLKKERIGAAVVSADGQHVDGVISERDIAFALCTHLDKMAALPVSALMTKHVIVCTPEDAVGLVASKMQAHSIRHIPVVQDGILQGIVSIRDVLNLRVDELQRSSAMLHTLVHKNKPDPGDRG